MKLFVGDKIVCIKELEERLIYGESYTIIETRVSYGEEDICIDVDGPWWFGQIGFSEPWTNWFILEKQWVRDNKLKELGI